MNANPSRRISATIVLIFGLLFATQSYGATNVTISTAATANMNYAAGVYTPVAGAATASINVTELQTYLGATNVSVNTASSGSNTGSITVSTAVTWSSGYGLTLNANGNLTVNASISNGGMGAITLQAAQGVDGLLTLSTGNTLTTAAGAVNLTAGTATKKGSLNIGGSIASNNGNITIANTVAGADNQTNNGTGIQLSTGTIDAGAGNITVTGNGQIGANTPNCQGLNITGSVQLKTGTGSITLNGNGGSGASDCSSGIIFSTSTVSTVSGDININGQGGGTYGRRNGIDFWGGTTAKIYSGSGNINLTGKGSGTGQNAFKFDVNSASTVYIGYDGTSAATTGNISFAGDANVSYFSRGSGTFKVKGQGNLIMKSNSSVGSTDLTLSGVIQGTAWKKIKIGDQYVDGIALSDNLTNTSAGDSINVVSKGGIAINNPIVNNTTGKPVLLLAAQGAAGGLTAAGAVTTTGGDIKLYAGLNAAGTDLAQSGKVTLTGNITSGGGNISIANSNVSTNATGLDMIWSGAPCTISSGAGNITLNGYAKNSGQGVSMCYISLLSTTGNINITGTEQGNSNGLYNVGVYFHTNNAGVTIATTSGSINITGYCNANTSSGIYGPISTTTSPGYDTKIYSTSGSIVLNGINTTGGNGAPVLLQRTYLGYDNVSTTTTGDITVIGGGASSSVLSFASTYLKSAGGIVTIGDNGGSLGNLTINSGLIVSAGSYRKFNIGGNQTNGVTINNALTTRTTGGLATDSINVRSKAGITIAANLTANGTGAPITLLAAQGAAGTGTLTTVAAGTLTTANGEIKLRSGVSADNATISTAAGHITLGGAVSMGATGAQPIDWRASGDMTISSNINTSATAAVPISLLAAQGVDGLLTLSTGNTLTTAAGAVNLTAGTATYNGAVYVGGGITSNNGTITIQNTSVGSNGTREGGVAVETGTLSSGAGDIIINGYGGNSNGNAWMEGIYLNNSSLLTTSGNITLKGTGGSGSTGSAGIMIQGSQVIRTTTSGIINLTGQGGASGTRNDGIWFYGGASTKSIYSAQGDVNLIGIGIGTNNGILTDFTSGGAANTTVYIGYDGTNPATTGNINIKSISNNASAGMGYLWRNSGTFKIKGQGNLSMTSLAKGTDGTTTYSGSDGVTLSGVIQGTAWKKITIGDKYTGLVSLSDNLTNTAAGDSINVVSKGSITINNPITNNTAGKPIFILAAQGAAGTGTLTTAAAGTLTTTNGEIKLRSGVSANNATISTAAGHITVNGAVSMGATGAQPIDWRASGNMTISANINTSATSAVPISLLAAQGVDGLLTLSTGYTLTTNTGIVQLYAGTGSVKGSVYVQGSITSNNGNITIYNTAVGGATDYGVALQGGTISAGLGNILLTGYGMLSGGTNADGLALSGSGIVTTTSGTITLNGTGGSGSSRGAGILAYSNFTINSGSGAISLTGRGAGTHLGNGIHFYGTGSTTKIYSTSGDINLNGIGGGTQGHAFITDYTNSANANENVYIGYDGTSTGTTGNITFVGDATPGVWKFLYRNTGVFKVKGQGNLIMKSNSSVGSTDLTLSGVIQGTAWKKIKIGDQYIGTVTLSDNLTNTAAGDSINVVSKGSITINNPIVNNTAGKPVNILAAQGAAGSLAINSGITTTGGDVAVLSGVKADGITDTGYAGSFIQATGTTISTSGGDIIFKTTSNSSYYPSSGNSIYGNLQSGAGNINIFGTSSGSNGLGIANGSHIVATGAGTITLKGISTYVSGASGSTGLGFDGNSPVSISAVSDILMEGTGVLYGVMSYRGTINVYTTTGNLTVNAISTDAAAGKPFYTGETSTSNFYLGYNGTSVVNTGDININMAGGSPNFVYKGNTYVATNGGNVVIGDNGSALGAVTLPASLFMAAGNYKSILVGGANTASVVNNCALTAATKGIALTAIGDISGTGTLSTVNDTVIVNTSAGTGALGYSGILSGATRLKKAGAGVFKMTVAAQTFTGSTTLKEGTLLLNPSATTATWASPMILDGGALATTGITANTTWTSSATLNLKSASSIVLDPATVHTLTFANSSGESWNTAAYLYVTNWAGTKGVSGTAGKIKFTTTPLTAAQLGITLFCNATSLYPGISIAANEVVPSATPYAFITKKSGNWNDPATWGLSDAPAGTQNYPNGLNAVTINNTDVVAVTADNFYCSGLTFNGAGRLNIGSYGFNIVGLQASNSGAQIDLNGGHLHMQAATSVFAGVFSGSGTIQQFNVNNLTLSGISTFNGTFQIETGCSLLAGSNTASLANASVTNNSSINLAGYNFSIGALSGLATVTNDGTADAVLTVGTKSSTTTYSGKFTNGGTNKTGLTVVGGVLTLTKNTGITHTGATTVTAGELRLNPSANATGWASPLILNGGTLGTAGIAVTRTWTSSSTLKVTGNSVLALESANSHTLTFANSSAVAWTSGKILTITGWQGSYNGTTGTKGKLILGASGLTATQLQQIRFLNSANGKYYGATMLASGEVVASGVLMPVFSYPQSLYSFTTGAAIAPLSPTVTDGAPITAYSVSPALPTGLSLNTGTGEITGTPVSATASATYTITATNAAGMGTFDISITVNVGEPVITYNTPNTFAVGTAISLPPISTGGAVESYSVSPSLPAGLSLDTTTGVIDGTPTAITATGTYTVTATNAAGSGSFGISITVNSSVKKLTLKVYLEGLWNGTAMNKCKKWNESLGDVVDKFSADISDTLRVELHDATTYSTVAYRISGLELHQDGSVTSPGLAYINIPTAATGNYFITIKHRNHLETTSATAVSFTGDVNYDFTDASTKAYVDPDATFTPMKTLDGKWMLYAGDVDKTGDYQEINISDYMQIFDNYSDNTDTYGYLLDDLNGDGLVDIWDCSMSSGNGNIYFYKE